MAPLKTNRQGQKSVGPEPPSSPVPPHFRIHILTTYGLGGIYLMTISYALRLRFKGAVQFNNNEADEFGGGIAVEGGDVT